MKRWFTDNTWKHCDMMIYYGWKSNFTWWKFQLETFYSLVISGITNYRLNMNMASKAPKNLDIFQKFSSKLLGECESDIFVVFNGDWIFLC